MKELPKVYEPKSVEKKIYDMWMQGGYFKGKIDPDKKPFSIVMPPPTSPASSTWGTRWTPRFRTS